METKKTKIFLCIKILKKPTLLNSPEEINKYYEQQTLIKKLKEEEAKIIEEKKEKKLKKEDIDINQEEKNEVEKSLEDLLLEEEEFTKPQTVKEEKNNMKVNPDGNENDIRNFNIFDYSIINELNEFDNIGSFYSGTSNYNRDEYSENIDNGSYNLWKNK